MTSYRDEHQRQSAEKRELAKVKYEAYAQAARARFLASGGVPEAEDSWPDDPVCEGCRDVLWVAGEVRAVPCPVCKPRPDPMQLFDAFRVPESYGRDATKALQIALEAARRVAEQDFPFWLVMIGPNGSGKTHLARAVLAAQLAKGRRGVIQTAEEIIQVLRSAHEPNAEISVSGQLDYYRRLDWLVIDELGKERQTPFAVAELEGIINRRYSDRTGLIVTSNMDVTNPPKDSYGVPVVPPAVSSRLADREIGEVVYMAGVPDYRRRKDR